MFAQCESDYYLYPMISANELRVGLWFKREIPGRFPTWEDIRITEEIMTAVFSDSLEYALNDFYGIDLTPEILEQCGYECIGTDDNHEDKLWKKDNCEYQYCENGSMVWQGVGYSEWKDLGSDILYLHQLQNIFFYLESKELEVKIPQL